MEEQREYQWCSAGPGRMISAEKKINMNSSQTDASSMEPPATFFQGVDSSAKRSAGP